MALVTTPGSATADSYATLDEANTYFSDRRVPVLSAWSNATDPQKETALRMGALLLDRLIDWTGGPVDNVQARVWPRQGMVTLNGFGIPTSGATSIPIELKDAQCEFAGQLLTGDRVSDNDALVQGITSVKAGSVAVTFKDTKEETAEAVDIMLRRKTHDLQWASKTVPDLVRQYLVESWYRTRSVRRPALFQGV